MFPFYFVAPVAFLYGLVTPWPGKTLLVLVAALLVSAVRRRMGLSHL